MEFSLLAVTVTFSPENWLVPSPGAPTRRGRRTLDVGEVHCFFIFKIKNFSQLVFPSEAITIGTFFLVTEDSKRHLKSYLVVPQLPHPADTGRFTCKGSQGTSNLLLNTFQGVFPIPSSSRAGFHLQSLETVWPRTSDTGRCAVDSVRAVRWDADTCSDGPSKSWTVLLCLLLQPRAPFDGSSTYVIGVKHQVGAQYPS